MKKGMFALGRMKAGTMNSTEQLFAAWLEEEKAGGRVLWWRFEAFKLRLADNTFYSPDFVVMLHDQTITLYEVKGFWMDDSRVKIKVAAEQFPMLRFTAVKKQSKKNGGGWLTEDF